MALEETSPTIFIFLTFAVVIRISVTDSGFCQQALFEKVTEGEFLTENIISTHHVHSWLECGRRCLREGKEKCTSFSYLGETRQEEVNCQLGSQAKTAELTSQHGDTGWAIYEIREAGSEWCSSNNRCQNGGQCIDDLCETEGYRCRCSKRYQGTHCERENNEYDLSFSKIDSYVQMNPITSNLDQLTFASWLKITPGLRSYHLLSYMANGVAGYIDLSFKTDDQTSKTVGTFLGKVVQHGEATYMTPINDGFWHHLGFTWSNTGHWNVLIDGTPRAIRSGVQIGKTIPGGGTLVIGQKITSTGFVSGEGFLGEISRLNLWDRALSGYEIETMAKLPGNEAGNLIRWFKVLDYVSGDVKEVTPSTAHNTDQGLDVELSFESPRTEEDYVLAPGPSDPFGKLSVCLWMYSSSSCTFISYNTDNETGQTFAFGIDSNYLLFAYINGILIRSTLAKSNIINNHWHFLCFTWDGELGETKFYYEGWLHEKLIKENTKITLPAEGNFSVGVTKNASSGTYTSSNGFVGTMSYLNIWSIVMKSKGIVSMSSGGVNINGDVLSWRNVPKWITGNLSLKSKTIIYFPGYGLLAKRSKWCNDHVTSSCGTLYARLGQERDGKKMAWRCYCASALHPSKYAYDFGAKATTYYSRHEELIAIGE